jgi:hypothetical protein
MPWFKESTEGDDEMKLELLRKQPKLQLQLLELLRLLNSQAPYYNAHSFTMNPLTVSRIAHRRLPTQCLRSSRTYTLNRPQWTPSRSIGSKRKTGLPKSDEIDDILKEPIRNPLDEIAMERKFLAKRAHHIRRIKFAGVGLAICVIAQLLIVYQMNIKINEAEALKKRQEAEGEATGIEVVTEAPATKEGWSWFPVSKADASDSANKTFQGKEVIVAPGGQKLLAHDGKTGEDIELVETGTSTIPHFPKTIQVPSTSGANDDDTEYTLLGLGIRTVSFLSVQVYVVGLYIQTSSLATLQSKLIKRVNPLASSLVSTEKDELRTLLLDGDSSYELWDSILSDKSSGIKTAVRVVPTRNTDFGHLRDGWVRGITARTQLAQKKGDTTFQDETFGTAMKDFKAMMQGKGSAPTGSVILLTRDGDGTLGVLYQDKKGKIEDFGTLRDERIARLMWLGYLGGKTVSSEGARQGVVDGIIEVVSRPLGSVETKVS